MSKSVWEGHLRLSLVTCPVALYKATDPKGGVAFHLINPKTKSRIVQVVKDPTTGEELDRKTLARGFEVSKNRYVLFDPEELKALRIESTHVLELERFALGAADLEGGEGHRVQGQLVAGVLRVLAPKARVVAHLEGPRRDGRQCRHGRAGS